MAVDDRGLASPYELSVCFMALLDLSASAVHNQSAHKPTIHRTLFAAPAVTYLSPLSTDRGLPTSTCRLVASFASPACYAASTRDGARKADPIGMY
jgi:hypothetical protein